MLDLINVLFLFTGPERSAAACAIMKKERSSTERLTCFLTCHTPGHMNEGDPGIMARWARWKLANACM